MSKPLENPRRIVTGYDAQGKAMVVIDEPVVMEEIAGTKYRRGASWIVNSVSGASFHFSTNSTDLAFATLCC